MNPDNLNFKWLVGILLLGLFPVPVFAAPGAGLELDGILGFQGTQPISLLLGLGTVLQYNLGGFAPMIYGEYSKFGVQYADQEINYSELNLGAGFKYYLSSGAGIFKDNFILLSAGRGQLTYGGLTDTAWRAGAGFGIVNNSLEYSISYFKYFQYDRTVVLFKVGWEFL